MAVAESRPHNSQFGTADLGSLVALAADQGWAAPPIPGVQQYQLGLVGEGQYLNLDLSHPSRPLLSLSLPLLHRVERMSATGQLWCSGLGKCINHIHT
jgi:hypothetical protein